MTTRKLNVTGLKKAIAADCVVQYYAPWCGYCKQLASVYAQVADQAPSNVHVVRFNMDKHGAEVKAQNVGAGTPVAQDVRGFPTVIMYKKDGTRSVYTGPRNADAMLEAIHAHYNSHAPSPALRGGGGGGAVVTPEQIAKMNSEEGLFMTNEEILKCNFRAMLKPDSTSPQVEYYMSNEIDLKGFKYKITSLGYERGWKVKRGDPTEAVMPEAEAEAEAKPEPEVFPNYEELKVQEGEHEFNMKYNPYWSRIFEEYPNKEALGTFDISLRLPGKGPPPLASISIDWVAHKINLRIPGKEYTILYNKGGVRDDDIHGKIPTQQKILFRTLYFKIKNVVGNFEPRDGDDVTANETAKTNIQNALDALNLHVGDFHQRS